MNTIFHHSRPDHEGYHFSEFSGDTASTADLLGTENLSTQSPALPEVPEGEVIRHFTNLSRLNHSVDVGFYPLGSCTMKYNPRINESVARLHDFASLHPELPSDHAQGGLEVIFRLEKLLAEILGMERVTMQPLAGAHGELTGLFIIQAYHQKRGENRKKIIVPDSSHGTNPASAAMAGLELVQIPSTPEGMVDLDVLRAHMDSDVAAFMLTNPNTLGIFDRNISEIADIVHECGALLYYDGANLNATMGYSRPGDCGFDVVHTNLHKTFATPHGGGGPGAGPVGVVKKLVPYLPAPLVDHNERGYFLQYDMPDSIGRMAPFHGNFGVCLRAFAYILSMGGEGLKKVSENAVLNANYLLHHLRDTYGYDFGQLCMHEFVLSATKLAPIRALDVAKRLLDHGIHAPTVYFPLIVPEAMMIEPTETENLEVLDNFIAIMKQIATEARETPEVLTSSPKTTPVGRLDETRAAREPILRCPNNCSS